MASMTSGTPWPLASLAQRSIMKPTRRRRRPWFNVPAISPTLAMTNAVTAPICCEEPDEEDGAQPRADADEGAPW